MSLNKGDEWTELARINNSEENLHQILYFYKDESQREKKKFIHQIFLRENFAHQNTHTNSLGDGNPKAN